MTDLPAVAVALWATAGLTLLAVLAAWHVWYALALGRVFVQHETEPWRAWVPILNEAELLRLGREDPVKAALFLVPVVNLYAVVLKAIAAGRIGRAQERPAGLVALAVVLPPLWATLLAAPRTARAATPAVTAPAAGEAAGAAAGGRAAARPAAPTALPAAPLPPSPGPVAGAAAPAAAAAPPASVPDPPAPAASAPAVPAPVTPEAPPLTRRAAALRRDGLDDATAIVRAPAGWELLLPAGDAVALTGRVVVLGRNPAAEGDAQLVAVADTTRTVSKRHARLEWDGRTWAVTDLDSTNGVSVTEDGAERMLPAGVATPVTDRFTLGDAVLTLRRVG